MKAKTKCKTVNLKDGKKYSDILLQVVKEAKEDYKTGKYFKGKEELKMLLILLLSLIKK